MQVFNVRKEATADASLAAIFERSRFGIAIAAMIKMIATTISNSISEKPFCLVFRMHGAPFEFNQRFHRACRYFPTRLGAFRPPNLSLGLELRKIPLSSLLGPLRTDIVGRCRIWKRSKHEENAGTGR